MPKGKVKSVFRERAFGFIRPDEGGKDVWFHSSSVEGELPFKEFDVGLEVEFEARQTQRGPQASRVRAAGTPPRRERQASPPYRFLNPYNFVCFQAEVSERPKTAISAAFERAGQTQAVPQTDPPEVRLIGRCLPPPHDRYVGITGKVTCTLEAVTPLFVSDSEDVRSQQSGHKSYRFFRLWNERGEMEQAIPGTSLRGMVRSVFEAVTNSCMAIFSGETRLSCRVDPAEALHLVPGRVEKDPSGSLCLRLLPGTARVPRDRGDVQYAAWVPQYLGNLPRASRNVRTNTSYGRRKDVNLNGLRHGDRCWALLQLVDHAGGRFSFWNLEQLSSNGGDLSAPGQGQRVVEGYLCITNQNIENKHDERFFFYGDDHSKAQVVALSPKVCKDYELLIRDYQLRHEENVRKRGDPEKPHWPDREEPESFEPAFSRFIVQEAAAKLKKDDLVYARLDEQGQYIVPVSVPRRAYDREIGKLLPKSLECCNDYDALCPACRVFGWVHPNPGEELKKVAYAGRVYFSHGELTKASKNLPETPLSILSSPKPTTTRFYLAPQNGKLPEKWIGPGADRGYDGDNRLRGRKFYRHHGRAREMEYRRRDERCDDQNRTVRDALEPGARFKFTVNFENLAPVELGALLWALEMDCQGVHRLGFAKPLGFGSVKVVVNGVEVLDPAERYRSMAGGWKTADNWKHQCVDLFKSTLARRYPKSDFESLANVQDLRILLSDPPKGLPVHYPRTDGEPTPEGRNFEWFLGNKRGPGYSLRYPGEDTGLPLIKRDGTEVK